MSRQGAGAYTYDYSSSLVPLDSYEIIAPGFIQNGSATAGPPTTLEFPSAGSFIWSAAVSTYAGSSANDYEVNTTLVLGAGGGTYIDYLRASSGALASSDACGGTYISVEVAVPSYYGGSGGVLAQVNINKCVSGALTNLASTSWAVQNGDTFRAVVFGSRICVYLNDQMTMSSTGAAYTTGQPGVGGYGMAASSGISWVSIGHHDAVAPNAVSATGVRSSVLPNLVSLTWQGATDDMNGIGVMGYSVSRNSILMGIYPSGAQMADNTVAPGTNYTYSIATVDFHGNTGPATNVAVVTPPATAVDPRRLGVLPTGSYWGGGGEQIDMLSGNLNFSLPLIKAMGRTGWSVPVGLSYNSQNWRQDSGTNWELGTDVGYGYGWTVQIGSITPYYDAWPGGVNHYVYTDGTGAQYILNQNSGNIWSSTQGIYVWFDANTQELHFGNGMFWLMGCVSGGAEQDAGTMYPTVIEDVAGNQVIVAYNSGIGLPSELSNAR